MNFLIYLVLALLVGLAGLILSVKIRGNRIRSVRRKDLNEAGLIYSGDVGLTQKECTDSCRTVCFVERPPLHTLHTLFLFPISRLRIECHDWCDKNVCGLPGRNQNTVCGYRKHVLGIADPLALATACIFGKP